MDKFYDLIPKQKVKEFCRETNYELSSLQCAYLVWGNKEISIETKHTLYGEIMRKMEDTKVAYLNMPVISLFEALKQHIRLEKNLHSCFSRDEISSVYIRSWINTFFKFYYKMSLPTPFQKGDILYCLDKSAPMHLCVFDSIRKEYLKNGFDNDIAIVYRISPEGDISTDYEKCSQLELLSGELPLKFRMYQALSDCIKGKISPAALLHAHYIYTTYPTKTYSSKSFINEDYRYVEELFEIKDNITSRLN